MLKRRHFSVDTSSPCREVQVSTPAFGRQNGVFPAPGRRNRASPAAPVASTLQNPLGTRSVDAEVSTSPWTWTASASPNISDSSTGR